jgi:hypothetical protein
LNQELKRQWDLAGVELFMNNVYNKGSFALINPQKVHHLFLAFLYG